MNFSFRLVKDVNSLPFLIKDVNSLPFLSPIKMQTLLQVVPLREKGMKLEAQGREKQDESLRRQRGPSREDAGSRWGFQDPLYLFGDLPLEKRQAGGTDTAPHQGTC